MTTINTRANQIDPKALALAKKIIAVEVAAELDALVEKMDAFLEMRIAAEFDELKDDIDALAIENAQLKNEVTNLTMENIALHIKLSQTP